MITVSLAATALAYIPIAAFSLPSSRPSGEVILSVLMLSAVCTSLAFLIFFALIDQVGPVRATVITYVNPAVAALLGVTILGESFTFGHGDRLRADPRRLRARDAAEPTGTARLDAPRAGASSSAAPRRAARAERLRRGSSTA